MSSWEHSCELDITTLRLLFQRQKANLRNFFCTRFSVSGDTENSVPGALSSLSIESVDVCFDHCWWVAAMVERNAATLDHLRLGFISRIAHDFAHKRRPEYGDISKLFSNTMVNFLSLRNLGEIHLSLGSLHLCGLNLGSVLQGKMALAIDSTKITQLRLESCPKLSQAFSILMDPAGPPKISLIALEDLFIRLEDPDAQFPDSLENFLTSIHGLIHLRVLIDNTSVNQDLEPILDIHGKTLRTLVWDERRGPRKRLDASTSVLSIKLENLKVVAQKCHSLTTLGIALDWEAMTSVGRRVTKQSSHAQHICEV